MLDRLKELTITLNKARNSYYNKNRELISDFEYDKLYDELEILEKKLGITLSNSPTLEVGFMVLDQFPKVNHSKKILSLDKTKSVQKIENFVDDKEVLISYKMDGVTIVLTYDNGELQSAITRGNGEIGENITHNFEVFENVPLKIPFKEKLIIRGEALISFLQFIIINESLDSEEKYKNPRNLCSGTIRQLNNKITKNRNVTFLAFSVIDIGKHFEKKSEQLNFIKELGFNIVEYYVINKKDVSEKIEDMQNKLFGNTFATDGLVITFNDIDYSNNLGQTSKFPKDSIAFKWADDLAETKLIDVEWNTSRTGLINPVAIFEPVELEGTTVNRASLHNVSIIKNLKLGIGDTISVYKANMIIPQVAENYTNSDNLDIPKICEQCGESTEIISIKDGLALRCTNIFCESKLINGIVHYVSRDAMNIEDFSKATIEKLMNEGFIKDYSDIYFLQQYEDNIINMFGFGEKSYINLINSIEKSKSVELYNFIYALGIDQVGLSNAKLLTKHFKNDLEAIMNANIQNFIEIDGFGEIIANNIVNYFSDEYNIENINKVLPFLSIAKNIVSEEYKRLSNIFENHIFVITGSVNKFKNRKELQSLIEKLGGKVSDSVSKNTSYLINNDNHSNSSKNITAKNLGISIITEEDFINLSGINTNDKYY